MQTGAISVALWAIREWIVLRRGHRMGSELPGRVTSPRMPNTWVCDADGENSHQLIAGDGPLKVQQVGAWNRCSP